MDILRKQLRSYFLLHFYSIERWRWVIILLVGVGLARLEISEFRQQLYAKEPFHLLEAILYLLLVIGNGAFLELFVRLNRIHRRMIKILEYKHKLSLDFSLINDWDSLIHKLAELPSKIVNAQEAYLLMENSITGKLEIVARWNKNEQDTHSQTPDAFHICQKCLSQDLSQPNGIHECSNEEHPDSDHIYGLKVTNQVLPTTILKFRLARGLRLSHYEEKIFNNIADEIAVAVHAGRDHRLISELQSAKVAMAERRTMSAYLHDQLGQNLGFLHLKLDQLSMNNPIVDSELVLTELERLREIASNSYEIVRDILKKLQPETIPHLTNLLKEHATRVARASNFSLNFACSGAPIQLAQHTQQTIFHAFHEILNNVQKHSMANVVDVCITWSDSCLEISIVDNGVGFDPTTVQKHEHFGLEILRERIAQVGGHLLIDSSPAQGTSISIAVPILSQMRVLYEQTGNERSLV